MIDLKTAVLLLVLVLLIAAPLPACTSIGAPVPTVANTGYTMGCPGCPGCPDNPVRDPNAPACY